MSADSKLLNGFPPMMMDDDEPNEIWITEFNDEVALKFQRKAFESIQRDPRKPFVVKINSPGGEVHALLSMLDTMDVVREMAVEGFGFITIASGKAFSAGAVLLASGDLRVATRNSSIMIHQVVGGSWGSHPENQVEFAEIARLNQQLLTILKEKCKLKKTMKDLEDLLKHNLYLTPKDAKEYGLIDDIGYAVLREHRLYEVELLGGNEDAAKSGRTDKKVNENQGKGGTIPKAPKKPGSGKKPNKRGTPENGDGTPKSSS